LAPVPLWTRSAPECVAGERKRGVDPAGPCGWSHEKVFARRAEVVQWLKETVTDLDSVRLVDPIDAFCTETWCRPYDGETLLYTDHSHLSSAGVERLITATERDLRWVMGIPEPLASRSP